MSNYDPVHKKSDFAWWPSAGKELSSWLSALVDLAVFIACVPFPFGV